jgi:hypothetical protein
MELDNDLNEQKTKIEFQIDRWKKIGIGSAIVSFCPILILLFGHVFSPKGLTYEEVGTYIGGVSVPFASLASVLFIYVAFLGQRLQILFQQQDIRQSSKELELTREEIKGQKLEMAGQRKQLEIQNKQIKLDQLDRMFLKLLDSHSQIKNHIFYGRKWDKMNKVIRDDPEGKDPFKSAYIMLEYYPISDNGWKKLTNEEARKIFGDGNYILFRDDFEHSSALREEIQFIFKMVYNEEVFGAYSRLVHYIIDYLFKNNLLEYLAIFESHMTKFERVYLYYWSLTRLDIEKLEVLKSNKFLFSIDARHLIVPNHFNFLYPERLKTEC